MTVPKEPSVFFIGDVTRDDYFAADRWPAVADKAYVRPMRSYVGGMVANAASVYAGLGGQPEFISLLNDGPVSAELCRSLNDRGISTQHMLHDPVIRDSLNLIFLVGDEHVVLTIDIGQQPMLLGWKSVDALQSPGYLYTTLNRARRIRTDDLSPVALIERFRRSGRKLFFDLDVEGLQPDDAPLFRGADMLIMNQLGFERSFGTAGHREIGAWMRAHRVSILVRTLAADGAEAFHGDGVIKVPGHLVPIVDVTGAGDTFGGALLFGLTRNWDLEAALSFAVAAASRAVTVEGPQGGIATLAEIRAFQDAYRDGRSMTCRGSPASPQKGGSG